MVNDIILNRDVPKVLIVDDNPVQLKLIQSLLKQEGYEILEAKSGKECIDVCNKHMPNAILLDVLMPGTDGFEVCRMIQKDEYLKEIPIIFHSSLDQNEYVNHGITIGGADYLTKPVAKNILLARLKFVVEDRLQKAQNEKLKQKLDSLVNDQEDLILELDENYTITFPNKKFIGRYERYIDFNEESSFLKIVHAEDQERVKSHLLSLLMAPNSKQIEFRDNFSGELKWWSWNFTSMRNSSGQVKRFLGVGRDITQSKKLYNDLEVSKEKVKEQDLLKSSFIASMSHGLRTPLNAVVGFSDLIIKHDIDISNDSKYIEQINYNGHKLLNMINDLVIIMQLEAGKIKINRKKFSINAMFDSIAANYRERINDDVDFLVSYGLDSKNDEIYTDPFSLKVILNQLLDNAVKYTKEGQVDFSYSVSNDFKTVIFKVEDTGPGIRPEMQKKLFESFYRPDRKVDGTGLGLPIAKGLTDLLGGSILLDSKLGEGTVLELQIPFV